MSVLVTGSKGFIGSALMVALGGAGRPYDIANEKKQDIRAFDPLSKAMKTCDAVVHLAALSNVDECEKRPAKAEAVNGTGTFSVLRAASVVGIRRAIVASSVAADHRDSVYGWSKHVAEQWCQMARERWDMELTVLRLADVYGPGSAEQQASVVRWMQPLICDGATSLAVDRYACSDLVFVGDVVQAIKRRLDDPRPWDDEPWHYVGTRKLTNSMELADAIIEARSQEGEPDGIDIVREEAECEPSLAIPETPDNAFECPTPLEDGLRQTWAYLTRMHARAVRAEQQAAA